jgi:ferredoxin
MHVYFRGNALQRIRLASGLVLFCFAATHFLNHSLGLVSLEVMHQAQALRTSVTRSVPGSIILLAALVAHIGLGLHKIAHRKTWRMPRWEAVQICLGIAIPFLLFPHIVNTRVAHLVFGVNDIYLYELRKLWPDNAPLQSLLLLMVWTHGCIGLNYWLRLSDRYRRLAPMLLTIAVALPVLALAGFVVAGRATADIMSDADAFAALKERSHWPGTADAATLGQWRDYVRLAYAALLTATVTIPFWRYYTRDRAAGKLRISIVGGPTIEIEPGKTLLEASRSAKVAHASVCGGRARCTTCRVKIEKGLESLAGPVGAEAITLQSIEAPSNVRLACQVRPTASLTVSIISRPATPGPPQADFVEIKDVVAAHVRAILSGQIVDVKSDDPAVVQKWAQAKVSYPFLVSDLKSRGFLLAGGRLDYLADRPALALAYVHDDRPISVFVLPSGGFNALAVRGQRNGYHVLAWTNADSAYFAVSDLDAGDLDRMEDAFSPESIP